MKYFCTMVSGRKRISFTAGTQMLCIEVGWIFSFSLFFFLATTNFKLVGLFPVTFESVFSPTESRKIECLLIKKINILQSINSIIKLPCRTLVAVSLYCILLNSQATSLGLIC